MPRYGRLLTDAQWEKIRPLLLRPPRHRHDGRPRAVDRKVLEGILWILRSGARWRKYKFLRHFKTRAPTRTHKPNVVSSNLTSATIFLLIQKGLLNRGNPFFI